MRTRRLAVLLSSVFGCAQAPVPAQPTAAPARATGDAASADEHACQDRGDGAACGRAAEQAWEGKSGHALDRAKSFRDATRGCDAGDGLACAVLGQHYENGIGVDWAPERAVAIYEKACLAGAGLGCARLGAMYFLGHGVDPDREKSASYRKRARAHWVAACQGAEPRWCTSAASLTGRDDQPTALALDQRACDRGIALGCVDVIDRELPPDAPVPDAAVRELDRLCRGGEPHACGELAAVYGGEHVPADRKDPQRALAMTKQGCELGEARACVSAGILYEIGGDIPRDDALMWRYFGLGCDRGEGLACLALAREALLAHHGRPEIAGFAQRGCQMGNGDACDLLVTLHAASHDEAAVVRWATAACRLRSDDGCRRLIEHDGELPAMAPELRRRLYQRACDAGSPPACRRLSTLEVEVPRNVPPTTLEANRIAGEKNIVPDRDTSTAIAAAGYPRMVGSFKLCLDTAGVITNVTLLKSTGFAGYDQTLQDRIHEWRYRPFVIDGKPAPVCTAVTFIYKMDPPAPASPAPPAP